MNNNQTSFSHQNYGENFYVPPSTHHNIYDLNSNSTQTSQIDNDALQAQRAAENDQFAMVSPSVPQDKPKNKYEIHYYQPGDDFAQPSQSQSLDTTATTQVHQPGTYMPIFPKKEGQSLDSRSYDYSQPYTSYSCYNCGRCSDCAKKNSKKKQDPCTCCMKWTLLIAFGICIVAVCAACSSSDNNNNNHMDCGDCNGDDCDCSGDCGDCGDCCDEPKKQKRPPLQVQGQSPFIL